MIYNDVNEIKQLNLQWQDYMASSRLKNLFHLPVRVLDALEGLNFISCVDHREEVVFNAALYYPDYDSKAELPTYSFTARMGNEECKMAQYLYLGSWLFNSMNCRDYFQITREGERFIEILLDNFNMFKRLGNIRTELMLQKYKKRFLGNRVMISDVFFRGTAYYLLLSDGTEAEIGHVPSS